MTERPANLADGSGRARGDASKRSVLENNMGCRHLTTSTLRSHAAVEAHTRLRSHLDRLGMTEAA